MVTKQASEAFRAETVHRVFVMIHARESGKYLAILRKDDGTWGLPGGKVELSLGESPEAAIYREAREEINYQLQGLARVYDFLVDGKWGVAVYLARTEAEFMPDLNLDESTASGWFSWDEWPEPSHPQMTRLIDMAGPAIDRVARASQKADFSAQYNFSTAD